MVVLSATLIRFNIDNYLSNENDISTYLVKNMIYREGESLWIILLK